MSGADDQQAADIAVLVTATAHDPLARATLDRLRAELAETRAKVASHEADLDLTINRLHNFGQAGDALADDADRVQCQSPPTGPELRELESSTQRWRSVRGDARTDGPMTDTDFDRLRADVASCRGADVRDPASETHRTSAAPAADTAPASSVREELDLPEDAPESAVVGRLRLLKSRYERLSEPAEKRAAAGPRAGDTTPSDGLDVRSEVKRMIESNDRLRSEAAALERQRDHLQGQLDIIHDAEYTRNDTLKRENTRLRDAGNPLAHTVVEMLTGPAPEPGDWWHRIAPLADTWWSAAGGDA